MNDIKNSLNPEEKKANGSNSQLMEHYYGDLVRRLFMFAAVTMAIGLPFVLDYLSMPLFLSLFAIVILGIFAGLTSPKHPWVMLLNTVIALIGVMIFEYFAIGAFIKKLDFFFVANQILALVFLFALYYSTKTLRGKFTR